MNDAQCVCVYKYIHFMSLNNLSQMRKGDEKAKFYENHWVYAVKILDHFQRKIKITHILPKRSAHRDDNFLQT